MAYCDWFQKNDVTRKYHEEWGVPVHDDTRLFEYLCLEVMQCGLNFRLMLQKREIFRQCFAGWNYEKISHFNDADVDRILHADGMIRSSAKIHAIIHNAECFMQIREEYGSFDRWLWNFTDGRTILYDGHENGRIPASNALSARVSRALKKKGFQYLGPVVVYSYLQACGLINDHGADCPYRKLIIDHYPCIRKRRYGEKGLHQF